MKQNFFSILAKTFNSYISSIFPIILVAFFSNILVFTILKLELLDRVDFGKVFDIPVFNLAILLISLLFQSYAFVVLIDYQSKKFLNKDKYFLKSLLINWKSYFNVLIYWILLSIIIIIHTYIYMLFIKSINLSSLDNYLSTFVLVIIAIFISLFISLLIVSKISLTPVITVLEEKNILSAYKRNLFLLKGNYIKYSLLLFALSFYVVLGFIAFVFSHEVLLKKIFRNISGDSFYTRKFIEGLFMLNSFFILFYVYFSAALSSYFAFLREKEGRHNLDSLVENFKNTDRLQEEFE